MRFLKFSGAIIGTLLLVFLLSFGFNFEGLYTIFENQEELQEGQEWVARTSSLKGLTAYIREHPQNVSVASFSIENPDTSLLYTADTPRTMGTLSNFFLITTYARLLEDNRIDADEMVPWTEVDQYQLPFIDATNHTQAYDALEEQEAVTPDQKVPLGKLVQTAIIYNDLAISDYLFFKLGRENIEQTLHQLNLQDTQLPLPFSGLYISLHPGLSDTAFDSSMNELEELSIQEFRERVISNSEKYAHDSEYHHQVESVFKENQGLGIRFSDQRDMLSLFPQSTARELATLMKKVQEDSLISPEVSAHIQQLMSWPHERQGLQDDLKAYGALYDMRLGLLNGIDYGSSTYSEEPFAQAVFFDSLQIAFWLHMSSNNMHQDYQQRLLWDPALRESTHQQISNSRAKN